MPTHIVVEGDTDRVALEALDLVSPDHLLPNRSKPHNGRDHAIAVACALCPTLDATDIALGLDLNGGSEADLFNHVIKIAKDGFDRTLALNGDLFTYKECNIHIIPVGLPGDDLIQQKLRFTRFAMDDYLVKLIHSDVSFAATLKSERLAKNALKDPAEIRTLVLKLIQLAKANGVEIDSSKRYLDFVRGLIGFSASRAKFAELLILKADPVDREKVFAPLKEALTKATS